MQRRSPGVHDTLYLNLGGEGERESQRAHTSGIERHRVGGRLLSEERSRDRYGLKHVSTWVGGSLLCLYELFPDSGDTMRRLRFIATAILVRRIGKSRNGIERLVFSASVWHVYDDFFGVCLVEPSCLVDLYHIARVREASKAQTLAIQSLCCAVQEG